MPRQGFPRTYRTGAGQELENVHHFTVCLDSDFCVIHHPMPGPWEQWPTYWRTDRAMMERLCPHGVGHPVAENYGRPGLPDHFFVHGCCGCPCSPNRKEASK